MLKSTSVRCRRCGQLKWRGDICPTADCTSRKEVHMGFRKGRKSTFAITVMVKHHFHAEKVKGGTR